MLAIDKSLTTINQVHPRSMMIRKIEYNNKNNEGEWVFTMSCIISNNKAQR